ncbi:hypothetical protein LZI70_19675 (plasmid) [Vibrio pelagius]|uniref:Uncharacterized protein n=1 Tax=Vibrio pelagius TaxID=28169 RepID=A0ABY5GB19_VIBPE|nr:hypothetical protein [Vibrio pelagius]UTT87316.1 hypothetical protein LZI70_19675 [Vibrio pelagius]
MAIASSTWVYASSAALIAGQTLQGGIFIMIAATCWTIMGMIVKPSKTTQAFAFNVWGMLFAPIPLVMFAAID